MLKEYKDSRINTVNVDYIDATEGELISQKICYLIMKERELEQKLKEKDDALNMQKKFTHLFNMSIPQAPLKIIEEMKSEVVNFKDWNIQTIDDKCLIYSSLTPKELISKKYTSLNKLDNIESNINKKQMLFVKQLQNNSKLVSVCLIVLISYLLSVTNECHLISNSLLCVLFPLIIYCALCLSQENYEIEEFEVANNKSANSEFYKIKTKFIGYPDDFAHILTNEKHRKNWDMNIITFTNESFEDSGKSIQIQYETCVGTKINEALNYEFYQDENDVYYILESSKIDMCLNYESYRLYVIEKLTDKLHLNCYSLTIYGKQSQIMKMYKGNSDYMVNYAKGMVTYIELAGDLPSMRQERCKSFGRSKTKQEEKLKTEGNIKISYGKHSSLLDQINESAELNSSEIESYKMDQFDIKDTLLTIDNNDEEQEFEDNDQLYDEVDEILKTESDDLSQIKNEAIMYDNRNMRFLSKDSFTESNEIMISQKSDLDNDTITESPLKELIKIQNTNSSHSDEIKIVDSEASKLIDLKKTETKLEKISNGAVVSPNKSNLLNSAIGMSTITLDTISKKDFQSLDDELNQSTNSNKCEKQLNEHLYRVCNETESFEVIGNYQTETSEESKNNQKIISNELINSIENNPIDNLVQ